MGLFRCCFASPVVPNCFCGPTEYGEDETPGQIVLVWGQTIKWGLETRSQQRITWDVPSYAKVERFLLGLPQVGELLWGLLEGKSLECFPAGRGITALGFRVYQTLALMPRVILATEIICE